ncbi:MAG TPA: sigma-54 dependent transcriptional regulator [Bdellovibrionota bacterium]|nr:sigma-54 dependent transcriptional regulator [Bdellovibrionota bacterium]
MNQRILLVDDDPPNCESLKLILSDVSSDIHIAHSASDALRKLQPEEPTLVITDLKMPGLDGLELLKRIKDRSPNHVVILVTAYGSIPTAVEAMKYGAYDFLTKPLKRIDVLATVSRALEKISLQKENTSLRRQLQNRITMVGSSDSFRQLLDILDQAAQSEAHILLTGESGTGKGLAAQYIHQESNRAHKPFVTVNCAAIPDTLLESELFGHERGAYTGADKKKEGRFEVGNLGTIFLDEVGAIPLSLQAKLLRVLQDGTFERLGSNETLQVDVRIISASNENLRAMVGGGKFREDLYFRLNVIEIALPPLKSRMEDLPLLIKHFLDLANQKNHRSILEISNDVLRIFDQYSWPGNLRELQNVIERAVVLCRGDIIKPKDLPPYFLQKEISGQITFPVGTPIEEVERKLLEEALRITGGNKTAAAKLLGITPRTVYRKLTEEKEAL